MVLRLVICLWLSAAAEAASLRHLYRRRGLSVQCITTDAGTFCSEVDDCPLGLCNRRDDDDDDGNGDLDSVASESKDGLKPGAIAAIVLSVLFLLFFVPAIAILIKRRTSKQKAITESNSDNAENANKTDGETSTNKPEDAKNPWWGGSRTMKSPSDTDTVSAKEGKPNSNEVDSSSWWPSWMAADADPKSAKKEDIETPNTKNDEIVEPSSSWWNACSIFR